MRITQIKKHQNCPISRTNEELRIVAEEIIKEKGIEVKKEEDDVKMIVNGIKITSIQK